MKDPMLVAREAPNFEKRCRLDIAALVFELIYFSRKDGCKLIQRLRAHSLRNFRRRGERVDRVRARRGERLAETLRDAAEPRG